jgi:hypothetical protein
MTEPAAKPKRRRVNDPRNHVPTSSTRRQVWLMTGYGLPHERIAAVLGVSKATIARHYREELTKGLDQCNNAIVASLYQIATGKGPTAMAACAFWLKTRAHWQEKSTVEVAGANGGQLIVYSGALAEHDRTV